MLLPVYLHYSCSYSVAESYSLIAVILRYDVANFSLLLKLANDPYLPVLLNGLVEQR